MNSVADALTAMLASFKRLSIRSCNADGDTPSFGSCGSTRSITTLTAFRPRSVARSNSASPAPSMAAGKAKRGAKMKIFQRMIRSYGLFGSQCYHVLHMCHGFCLPQSTITVWNPTAADTDSYFFQNFSCQPGGRWEIYRPEGAFGAGQAGRPILPVLRDRRSNTGDFVAGEI